jgi:hypothetical protein
MVMHATRLTAGRDWTLPGDGPAFTLSHQRPFDVVGLLLGQIDRQTGPNHCGPPTLPIVNHPTLAPLANQESGWRRRLVALLHIRSRVLIIGPSPQSFDQRPPAERIVPHEQQTASVAK